MYSLNIISSIIKGDVKMVDSNDSEKQLNSVWFENFYKNGGVTHLIKLMFRFELEHFINLLGFECLNNILNLLSLISSLNSDKINLKNINGIDYNQLLIQISQIILFIFKSSAYRDNDKKLISLQNSFLRQKQRLLAKKLNSIKEPEDNVINEVSDDFDDYHQKIRENWINEENTINKLTLFINNFLETEFIIKFFITNHLFVEIIQYGLIVPKNFKMKYTFYTLVRNLILSNSQSCMSLIRHFYDIIFHKDTLDLSILHSMSSEAFYRIVNSFLITVRVSLIYNENNVKTDRYEVMNYSINYIKSFLSGKETSELILNGFFIILRHFILENEKDLLYVETTHKLHEKMLKICFYSDGKGKLVN